MALRQVILTVLSQGDRTGYDIARQFDTVLTYFWRATHQQIYKELSRLSADGCVTVREVEQQGKPNKKIYRLTKAGKQELKDWLIGPTAYVPARVDLLVKLLGEPVIGAEAMQDIIDSNRAQTKVVLDQFRAMEKKCATISAAERSEQHDLMFLVLRRGLLLADAHQNWLSEVDQYLKRRKRL
jgi:DNA-binding PadR family transcriptional regulator